MLKTIKDNLLYIAWIQAIIATIGSLFFSEVMKFPPCVLCWYQRIAMYPLVIILLVGMIRKSKDTIYFALPLSVIGLIIAIYHNLLYYKFLPGSIVPCEQGISCTAKYIEWFGFVTIPLLSLVAFVVITACLIAHMRASLLTSPTFNDKV